MYIVTPTTTGSPEKYKNILEKSRTIAKVILTKVGQKVWTKPFFFNCRLRRNFEIYPLPSLTSSAWELCWVDFLQILVVRPRDFLFFRKSRIRLYLHRDCRCAKIGFYLHRDCRCANATWYHSVPTANFRKRFKTKSCGSRVVQLFCESYSLFGPIAVSLER